MANLLENVSRASIPNTALTALSRLRARSDVRVGRADDPARVWVRWPVGDPEVLEALLPIPGAVFYRFEAGAWYRVGCRLPSFDLPNDEDLAPLHRVIFPAPTAWEEPMEHWRPARLQLRRDSSPQATSALVCELSALARWAERASTPALGATRAARSEARVVLLGNRLPWLEGAERFWGHRLLIPLGWRPEPELSESELIEAMGEHAKADCLILFGWNGVEFLPADAFQPLTRASVRLALEQTPFGARV